MSTTARRQELPPSGGYDPLNFARQPAKKVFKPIYIVAFSIASTVISGFLIAKSDKKYMKESTEEKSSMLALLPLFLAERDRLYLKQLRRNRDEEADLMKNVEGWTPGTYYGEPRYKFWPKDKLLPMNPAEYYAHYSDEDFELEADLKRNN